MGMLRTNMSLYALYVWRKEMFLYKYFISYIYSLHSPFKIILIVPFLLSSININVASYMFFTNINSAYLSPVIECLLVLSITILFQY